MSNIPAVVNVIATTATTSLQVYKLGAEDALAPPPQVVVVPFRRVTIEGTTTKRKDVGTRSVTTETAAMRRIKMVHRKVRDLYGVVAPSTMTTTISTLLQLLGIIMNIIVRIHPRTTIPSDISWVAQEH